MPVRTILFDLDRTLVDREASLRAALPEQYRRCGPGDGRAPVYVRRFLELDEQGYADKRTLFSALIDEFGLSLTVEELIDDFRHRCHESACLYEGAEALLRELGARGLRMGLVTNGSSASQRTKIEVTGIGGLFETILISEEVGLRKPDPRIFELAAATRDTRPEDCLFVGDNPERDIVGAGGAGMATLWLSHGENWPEYLSPGPTYSASGLPELRNLVLALMSQVSRRSPTVEG